MASYNFFQSLNLRYIPSLSNHTIATLPIVNSVLPMQQKKVSPGKVFELPVTLLYELDHDVT